MKHASIEKSNRSYKTEKHQTWEEQFCSEVRRYPKHIDRSLTRRQN